MCWWRAKLRILVSKLGKWCRRAKIQHFFELCNTELSGYLRLNYDKGFQKANIHIRESDICEIDSSEHLMLQFMDLILGSICFRLNNKHKIKDGTTNRRGKRTIVKEKLYKYINSKIRELHPGFNIGESTGISQIEERWTLPYSHWSFKPSNYVRDTSKAKK